MIETAAPLQHPCVDDYLELERDGMFRHEYVAGRLFVRPDVTRRHNKIAGNILIRLWDAAQGTSCRREKWGAYCRIPSLRSYLIVDHEFQRVERLFRLESGTWLEEVQAGSDGVFLLQCPQTHLFLTQIYAGIDDIT